jgi:hypothetical protein
VTAMVTACDSDGDRPLTELPRARFSAPPV